MYFTIFVVAKDDKKHTAVHLIVQNKKKRVNPYSQENINEQCRETDGNDSSRRDHKNMQATLIYISCMSVIKAFIFWKNLNFQYEYLHEIEAIWDIFLHVNQGSRREKSWGVKIS